MSKFVTTGHIVVPGDSAGGQQAPANAQNRPPRRQKPTFGNLERGLGAMAQNEAVYNSAKNLAPSTAPDQPYEPKLTVQIVLSEVYRVATDVVKDAVNSEWLVMKTTPEVLGQAVVDRVLAYLDEVAVKQGVREAPKRPDVDTWS
jgi:hypothetical protein